MRRTATDAALIDAACRGEPSAREALVDAWLPVVLGWTSRLGGPHVDAEDAAHDVCLVLLDNLATLRDPARFDAWLFGVTRRVLAAHRRRAWVKRLVPLLGGEADAAPSPHQLTEDDRLARRVRSVLDQLPAAQREVLVLCDLEERADSEVAALLGIPKATVKSRLARGRERFRAVAEQLGLVPVLLAVLQGGGS